MHSKEEIVRNWLPRYTGMNLEDFGEYILLTNFSKYVELFAEWNQVAIMGQGKPMQTATAQGITIINFGMGSPTAATVMDLLTAIVGLKKEINWVILFFPLQPLGAREPPMITSLPKCLLYRPLRFRKPYLPQSGIMKWTTGRVLFTQQTEGFGSMIWNSRNICKR
jgi:hypothetical protein